MTTQRNICCPGCFPIYQPNQMAHSDVGGCLWCDYEDTNKLLDIEKDLEKLFDDAENDTTSNVSIDSNQTECCICFELINKNKNNCITECGHMFCLKCLANSMSYGNWNCPYCRTAVIEPPEDEEDDDDDYEEDDDEELEEGEVREEGELYEGEDEDDDDDSDRAECSVEEVTRRLKENGISMEDLVCMLYGRLKKDDTEENFNEIEKKIFTIVDDADKEAYDQIGMAQEDARDPPSPPPYIV